MKLLKMRSLQSKILVLFIFLLLFVQLVSFFSTYQASQKLESAQLNNRITNAVNVFETQISNRRYYLSAFAETAAKDYGLKSVLKEDNKSFLIALNNHISLSYFTDYPAIDYSITCFIKNFVTSMHIVKRRISVSFWDIKIALD